jgi:AmmeMemoRadiSam system protein A
MKKRLIRITGCPAKHLIFLSGIFILWFLSSPSFAEEAKQNKSEEKISLQEENVKEGKMADSQKLNDQEGMYLLEVARKTIEQELFKDKTISQGDGLASPKFSERRGTFVTLTINDNLRGCIGHIIPQETLLEGIKENAINAAFKDPRFNPLSKKEWDNVKVEISILTDPKPLEYSDADDLLKKIRPDVDGVIIKKGYSQATFLPQVWEQLPDKKEFFTHLCLKAGMDGNEWKKGKLEVYTYQVQAFEEGH